METRSRRFANLQRAEKEATGAVRKAAEAANLAADAVNDIRASEGAPRRSSSGSRSSSSKKSSRSSSSSKRSRTSGSIRASAARHGDFYRAVAAERASAARRRASSARRASAARRAAPAKRPAGKRPAAARRAAPAKRYAGIAGRTRASSRRKHVYTKRENTISIPGLKRLTREVGMFRLSREAAERLQSIAIERVDNIAHLCELLVTRTKGARIMSNIMATAIKQSISDSSRGHNLITEVAH